MTKSLAAKQRGVALIMAMMIVALITVVATELSWRFELSVSRSGNRWAGMDAKAYLDGAEEGAKAILRRDIDDNATKESDHVGEDWASPIPYQEGAVALEIALSDAEGRFNLNMLRDKPPCNQPSPPEGVANCSGGDACIRFTEQQHVFIRLLQTFNVSDSEEEIVTLTQEQSEGITEAVIDWLDEDSTITGFGGAESDHYESLEPPQAIANNEMVSVSELQVLNNMPPKLYKQLVPHVIALPYEEVPKINIQTATQNVLRSIKAKDAENPKACDLLPFEEEVGSSFLSFIQSNAEDEGFKDIGKLKSSPDLPPEWGENGGYGDILADGGLFAVKQSKYFILNSTVFIGEDYVRRGLSLIKRESGGENENDVKINVVRRTDANF
ncbi:MAG: type II secretion system minor pseudopilin GspK [Agarilytica sp.]